MEQITSSKKYQNGIKVFWMSEGTTVNDFFSYDDLVEQRINALDLLNNPRLYLMNAAGHQIESAAAGCSFTTKTCEDEILITRLFDAPRDLVWRAWTEPAFVKQWWGPKNYTSPSCEIDLKVGGKYLFSMRSPEGKDFWSTGVYREIKRPERLVCTDSFADEKGNVVPATHYGMSPDFSHELLVTLTFEVQAGRTRLTLRHAGLPSGEIRDLTRPGGTSRLTSLPGSSGRPCTRKRSSRPDPAYPPEDNDGPGSRFFSYSKF